MHSTHRHVYVKRPTVVLPGSHGTISGAALNDRLDENGKPRFVTHAALLARHRFGDAVQCAPTADSHMTSTALALGRWGILGARGRRPARASPRSGRAASVQRCAADTKAFNRRCRKRIGCIATGVTSKTVDPDGAADCREVEHPHRVVQRVEPLLKRQGEQNPVSD
jgi:hypothetical protein